jgi:Peptidase family S41
MITRHIPLAAALLFSMTAAPGRAQEPPANPSPTAPRLSAAERERALGAIREVLADEYVFPGMRAKLVERLSRAEEEGRYDVEEPYRFAERVTEDLRDVARDGHLSLRHEPAQYAAALAPPASERGSEAFAERRALRANHGLTELRIFPGNIRYLKIAGFEWVTDETGLAYDGAMRFLREGDAVIIDLRGNGGGHAAAVQYLISHFLPADTLLLTFVQGSETPFQSRTLNHLPAGRLRGKPLYVLIDGNVASAAEELAYHVQQFKLGELVGAKTAGGANNNRLVPIAPGFILSVSVGRPVHAVSGTNWEGDGIAPSVEAAPARALDVGQSLALARLARAPEAAPELLAEYAWARVAVEARLRPIAMSPKQLRGLAGTYGEVRVELRDGALWLARPERETRRLSPLTGDGLFAVEGVDMMRVRFRTGALELVWLGEPEARVFRMSP